MDLTRLAKELGVSPSTISRALSRPEMVAPATRLRILSAVELYGCRPNHIARSLRTLQTKTIGLVVPNMRDDLFAEIVRVADRTARTRGYTVLVSSLQDDHLGPEHSIEVLLKRKVGGIISCLLETDPQLERLLWESEIPLVELDRKSISRSADAVVLDFSAAAKLAAEHLVGLGHRRIAIVLGPKNLYHAREALGAFRQVLRTAGIALPEAYVKHTNLGEQFGFEATERLLALKVRPTAIFLEHTEVAAGGLRALRAQAIRVPKDLSLVSFGDARWAHYVDAPLTVVSRPTAQMAAQAVERLFDRLDGKQPAWKPRIQIFQPELIIRQSTAAAEPIRIWKAGPEEVHENRAILNWVNVWNRQHRNIPARAEFFDNSSYEEGSVLTLAFAAGDAPDLFWAAPGQFLQFVECGFAADLTELFTPDFRADLSPSAIEGVSYEGKPYAIPFEQEPLALVYNRALLARADVEVPRTWHDLLHAAEKLKRYGITPIVVEPRPSNYQNFTFFPFLWQCGVVPVDLQRHTASFSSAGAVQALALWGTLAQRGYTPKSCDELTSKIHATAFGRGTAAMQVVGFWAVDFLHKYCPDLDFGVAPLPVPENGVAASAYGGWLLMVNRRSSNLEIAKRLAVWMFITGTEHGVEWCTRAATKFSPRHSVNAKAKAFFDQGPHSIFRDVIMPVARPEPRYPRAIETIINDALQQVMFRDVLPEDAAAQAQIRLEKILATRAAADRARFAQSGETLYAAPPSLPTTETS